MNFKMNYVGCTTSMLDSKPLMKDPIPYGGLKGTSRENSDTLRVEGASNGALRVEGA